MSPIELRVEGYSGPDLALKWDNRQGLIGAGGSPISISG
jgi:hypothetical protein